MNSLSFPFPLLFLFLFFLLSGQLMVEGSADHHHHHPHQVSHHHHSQSSGGQLLDLGLTKLFVFGDSYVDTGNTQKSISSSWKYPYGVTFPGKPTGRFSDGRVLTDFFAKYLGVRSPVPYKLRKVGFKQLKYGMNFANGGTGVFDTWVLGPNMTNQIDFFQQLINDSIFTSNDLLSSAALVSLAGNDYSFYLATNGSAQGWEAFISAVVNQLALNLKRIHGLGVAKIVVTGLQPLGCLPMNTVSSSFQQCNETQNSLVRFHNLLLQQSVDSLNNETNGSSFLIIDLYGSFMSLLHNNGSVKFEEPLKPCCVGISQAYSCGSVDKKGTKKYTVCEDPVSAFFWDEVHPTQEGWLAVFSRLQPTLHPLH